MAEATAPAQELRDTLDQVEGWAASLEGGAAYMRSWQITKLARFCRTGAQRALHLLDALEADETGPKSADRSP
jgi:hypothetical protein